MDRYNEYHKHDMVSNIWFADSNSKIEDYAKRAIEIGECNVFTTNHGSGGDIFEARDVCDKYGLNCKYGIEGYIVKNPLEKDARNYHIVLIPKTNIARKKLNKANSHANKEGFYYRPRLFLEDLLNNFEPQELYITTACVGGIIKDDDGIKDIFIPLYEKFGKNLFLEVQGHNEDSQKELNRRAIKLSNEFGLYLIAANDSHYIYPEQRIERIELMRGKNVKMPEGEDKFMLDYPTIDEMFARFQVQGILNNKQILSSINQTLVFDECENIDINKEIKMPSIYQDKTEEEKIKILKEIVNEKFKKVMDSEGGSKEDRKVYAEECRKEMKVIEETSAVHTSDYFLLNNRLFDLAINKYGGILTRTGRGSCGSFILNKILGLTQIDRLRTTLPLYSERFMSTARLLENKALPDFDANIVSQEPFVKASKELLGEYGCYPMIAYGTMKDSEAFRNVCRSASESFEEFNEIGKDIERYRGDKKWGKYIEEAQKYIGTIVSASIHPCAYLLSNDDIEYEVGVLKIGDAICAMITSSEADAWKYLKNDYLVVAVWDIISKVFELVGRPIMSVRELLDSLDESVWKLFDDGITCTLNQVGEDWATVLLRKYKPRSMEELAMFVAAIRPNFAPQREDFVLRKPYTTGSKDLDNVLQSTGHRVLFQENLMQYFEWLGVTPSESIGLIKKISKKKIKQEDFSNLEGRIREQWIKNTGSEDGFDKTWNDMQSQMSYGYNSPHGEATALDCLYGAYLKAKYPLEYYSVVLNVYKDDAEKTSKLTEELSYFDIKLEPGVFRHSNVSYTFDAETRTIYKGLSSIKYISEDCCNTLYEMRFLDFRSFTQLLVYIVENTSINSRQVKVLTSINFFKEFGGNKKLLAVVEKFYSRYSKNHVEKTKIVRIEEIENYEKELKDESLDIKEQIHLEQEYVGHISFRAEVDKRIVYVTDVDEKYTPRIHVYCIRTGKEIDLKVDKKAFKKNKIKEGDVLYCVKFSKKEGWKKEGSGFVRSGVLVNFLTEWKCLT